MIGSLAWIARQCRPKLAYYCSRLRSVASIAQVKHLKEANRVLQVAVVGADEGLVFKAGSFDWNDAVLLSINDASWAGETKVVDGHIFFRGEANREGC